MCCLCGVIVSFIEWRRNCKHRAVANFGVRILCLNSIHHTKIFVASVRFCNWLCQAVCSYEADLLLTYFTDETILTVTSILKITYMAGR